MWKIRRYWDGVWRFAASLRLSGREFQDVGPASANACPPYVVSVSGFKSNKTCYMNIQVCLALTLKISNSTLNRYITSHRCRNVIKRIQNVKNARNPTILKIICKRWRKKAINNVRLNASCLTSWHAKSLERCNIQSLQSPLVRSLI